MYKQVHKDKAFTITDSQTRIIYTQISSVSNDNQNTMSDFIIYDKFDFSD